MHPASFHEGLFEAIFHFTGEEEYQLSCQPRYQNWQMLIEHTALIPHPEAQWLNDKAKAFPSVRSLLWRLQPSPQWQVMEVEMPSQVIYLLQNVLWRAWHPLCLSVTSFMKVFVRLLFVSSISKPRAPRGPLRELFASWGQKPRLLVQGAWASHPVEPCAARMNERVNEWATRQDV